MNGSIQRLSRLVREFHDYSRGPGGVQPKRIDLGAEVERFASEQKPVAAARKIALACEVKMRPEVLADPDKLQQVFLNLATNAYDAMNEGGQLTLTIAQEGSDGCALFRDTGPGIAPDEQRKIFGLFYSTKAKGSGLGLAISERIIHAFGGRLMLKSEVGHGATFEVCLPLADSAATTDKAPYQH